MPSLALGLSSVTAASLASESNGASPQVEAAPAAEVTNAARLSSGIEMASAIEMSSAVENSPEFVTGVMTWLATDKVGNTVRVTSTYINDRADIDYEPSTTTQPIIGPPAASVTTDIDSNASDFGSIPVMTFLPDPKGPEDIPAIHPETHQNTVVAAESTPISPSLPSQTPPWANFGVPFILLNLLKKQQQQQQQQKPKDKDKAGQNGRVEEGINNGIVEDAYDREQLFELYKELVKDYGNTLMFPNVNEQEMLFPMPNGEIATGTLQTTAGTSFVVGSTTVGVGGPAATFKGEVVSLASQGLVVGTKLIPIQAVAPVNPTDYAAAVTIEEFEPITLMKPADNPAIMTAGSNTITAGGAPMITAGHSIFYNDHGEVVVDGTQTIDPTPVRNIPGQKGGGKGGGTGGSGGSNGSQAQASGNKQNDSSGGGAVTVNGIVVDGGAMNKNKAPATSLPADVATGTTSFITVTSGGIVKTIPAVPQSKPSATKVAGAAVGGYDTVREGVWKAVCVSVMAFVAGMIML
jgi:hypothetical protein